MSLSLISNTGIFTRSLGADVPFADRLLAGSICGGSVRNTKRSVVPNLQPNGFKGNPVVQPAFLKCSRAAGLRMARPLPADYWTLITVVRNHVYPLGTVNPLIADMGSRAGALSGGGLALAGAYGVYSVCTWYPDSSGNAVQGAYVSIEGQPGSTAMFCAGTITDVNTTAFAGINNAMVKSSVALTGRPISTPWSGSPAYAGTDARNAGDVGAGAVFEPELYAAFMYMPLGTNEVEAVYRWAQEYMSSNYGVGLA